MDMTRYDNASTSAHYLFQKGECSEIPEDVACWNQTLALAFVTLRLHDWLRRLNVVMGMFLHSICTHDVSS